ncbi:MAG TPA: hypothetical protein VH277_01585 [Gemmatimonadaceae bacterium]|jgi:hypothetical protein|nr:hypothetical protein [Gemmatimonadaceae bacterium]
MGESHRFPLIVVDGLRLDKPLRDALQPGRVIYDDIGKPRRLPRYFYEIPSWEHAMNIQLSGNFALWEFIQTDVREAAPLRGFPRYVPCAITLTALCLERFRDATDTFVHIAANGGYRTPKHSLNSNATTHSWGTAVNIYRVGDVYLDDREAIERFAALARQTLPGAWTRPFGSMRGQTDDHLHIDFGYVVSMPHDAPEQFLGFDAERRAS